MKDCYGSYDYKGWYIFFSYQSQLWEVEVTEKNIKKVLKDFNEKKYNEIVGEWYHQWYNPDLTTIAKAKKYIKENEEKMIDDLKNIINNL